MSKILLLHDKEPSQVKDELKLFIWSFSRGGNILYNCEVLRRLYSASDSMNHIQRSLSEQYLRKPKTLITVSIIEAILIDFISRIDGANFHLPDNVDSSSLKKLKAKIEKEKKPLKGTPSFKKRKMYHLGDIIKIIEFYALFGTQGDKFYEDLKIQADIRNRIHIENYNNNLEEKEKNVFTNERMSRLEQLLSTVWEKMITDYKRPWTSDELANINIKY